MFLQFKKGIRFSENLSERSISFSALILWAISLAKPYRKMVVIILVAMLLQALIGLATPWPLKIIIDNVAGHHPLPHRLNWLDLIFPKENLKQMAAVAAISYIAITALGSFADFLDTYYNEKVAQSVANDLRRRIYHHLQHLCLSYYDTHQTGKLLSTLTTDVSTIQDFASSILLNILVDSITIFGMIGIMFYLDADFTLVALAVAPFLLFFVARFKKAMKKATREVRKDQSNMLVILQQGLESIRAVNAFGREDFEDGKLQKISQETLFAALKARKVKSVVSPFVAVTVSLCTAFVLWRGADLILKGAMSVGALTVFIWYMNKFFSPVQNLAKMTSSIAQVTVALERIQAILNTDTIITEKPNAIQPEKFRGKIVFDHVSFAYNPESPVITDFNLTINPGERVGVCGPTGSGKSTLVSLIARFYDPTNGRVLIDDTDIADFKLDSLRSQIGFVLQDTVLFYGSIRENIAYGRPEATDAEIIEAAKLANADEFIEKMPHGYDTLVGERGLTLSGGQRQRIGIARAVVRNSPILILDEPTASLDTESEKLVIEALEKLMQGRTVITIAHRLSTIRDADKIIVLDRGSIAEQGTHEELLKKSGMYVELCDIQKWTEHTVQARANSFENAINK